MKDLERRWAFSYESRWPSSMKFPVQVAAVAAHSERGKYF